MADGQTPDEIAKRLEQEARQLAGSRLNTAFLKRVERAMVADVWENFHTSASPDGVPWAPVKLRIRGSVAAASPLIDEGRLRGSITGRGKGRELHFTNLTERSVQIGTVHKGANLLHAGGTIVPVRAKALAIPMTAAAKSSGGPRRFPRPLTMLWRRGARSGVLAEFKQGKGKRAKIKTIVQFLLVKSVTIPARPFVGFGVRLLNKIDEIARDVLKNAFTGKGGDRA